MQYTETELNKLIETVEKEFSAVLTKSEIDSAAPLVKAEEKPSEKKADKPEEKKEEKPADKKDAPPQAEEKPAQEGAEKPAPEAAAPPQAEAAQEESHGYDEEDMAHMEKMYASMSKAELKAHHDAIMKCAKAEAAPAAPAAAPADAAAAPIAKSEPKSHEEANGGQISANAPKGSPGAKSPASTDQKNLSNMEKSEKTEFDLVKSELEAEKAKSAELKKNFDAVQEFLAKLVTKVPQGKAITSLEQIAKSEPVNEAPTLSKAEITQILSKRAADPTLKKSDRDAINAFYLGDANLNTISHLLKI